MVSARFSEVEDGDLAIFGLGIAVFVFLMCVTALVVAFMLVF